MSLEREAQLAEVPLLGEIVTAIEAELAWARRHGRALSLLALPISDVAPAVRRGGPPTPSPSPRSTTAS